MNKEKRNIATKLETESKYLTNILDKEDVKDFKGLRKKYLLYEWGSNEKNSSTNIVNNINI